MMTSSLPDHPPVSRLIAAGGAVVAVGFGGFLLWSLMAPLADGAVAEGRVTVESEHKTVAHPQGGVIAELLVREGETVVQGQPLLRLDTLESQAEVQSLDQQHLYLLAQEARLVAARKGDTTLHFPEGVLEAARTDPKVAETLEAQRTLHASQNEAFLSQIRGLAQRIEQQRVQIASLRESLAARERQGTSLRAEIKDIRGLVAKGLAPRPRLAGLERDLAENDALRQQIKGQIAGADEVITETRLQLDTLGRDRKRGIDDELAKVQEQRARVADQLTTARARLTRHEVAAPEAGVVLNLRFVNRGGVIPAGAPILDLVPVGDDLTIDVRVRPNDIDAVRPGLKALVRMVALHQRVTPLLEGEVIRISPDVLKDPMTGQPYYSTRIRVAETELVPIGGRDALHPGMPVEVRIVTGERTMFSFLMAPITEAGFRAFRQ